MPDRDGVLTDEDRLAVEEFLGRSGAATRCASCGSEDWTLGDSLAELTAASGRTYPCVILFCETCGFVRLHSAVSVLGAEVT